MADPWELILHHTYSGTPGVVYDQSPGRGSHGVAVGLADSDFLTDGIATGSGAISFESGGRIRVPATKTWSPLSGVRVEVVCFRNFLAGSLDYAMEAGAFRIIIRGDLLLANIDSGSTHYSLRHYGTPAQEWMTIAFVYDGVSTAELYFNGTTVATVAGPLLPIDPVNSVTIGGETGTSMGFSGLIDEVKVWRVNPHRVDDEFTGRPVDESVKECWAEWSRGLAQALGELGQENPECPEHIRHLISRAIASVIRDGQSHSGASQTRWHKASDTYRQLWSEGNLDDIVPLMADLVSWLQLEGLDPARNADVIALFNDDCWKRLLDIAPPIECDVQFTDMLRDLAKTLELRDRNRFLNQKSGA